MSLYDRMQQKRAPSEDRNSLPAHTPAKTGNSENASSRPNSSTPAHNEGSPSTPTIRRPGPANLLNRSSLQKSTLGKSTGANQFQTLRLAVKERLVEELRDNQDSKNPQVVEDKIVELVNEIAKETNATLTRQDKASLVETIVDETIGLGPLEKLLDDPEVTEIMINNADQVFVEKDGKLTLSKMRFENNAQLLQIIDRIVSSIGRRVDESSPMVDARLKDGSRVNVIIPPLALKGPCMTIRKFAKERITTDDLIKLGSTTPEMMAFLRACVRGRLNILVSGGTGSGKTTTLNILSSFIPEDERIVTIEDAAELQLRQEHVVTLETRPANVEGRGMISIRELVINSLRMRPDRIVVGECRGGEALDMLQAMNTGHDGSLTTAHANNPREALSRLETMVLMAGADLPSRAIREQIAGAIQIVVQQDRLRDGTRKIVNISETLGFDGDHVAMQDIFTFKQAGIDDEGRVVGVHSPTGTPPKILAHLKEYGEHVPEEIFSQVKEPVYQNLITKDEA